MKSDKTRRGNGNWEKLSRETEPDDEKEIDRKRQKH